MDKKLLENIIEGLQTQGEPYCLRKQQTDLKLTEAEAKENIKVAKVELAARRERRRQEQDQQREQAQLKAVALFEKASENYGVGARICRLEAAFKTLVSETVLATANTFLTSKKKRPITHRDIAFVFFIHRRNVTQNADHSSPFKGIVRYSAKAAVGKLITGPLSTLHISLIMELLQATKLTEQLEPAHHDRRQAARYRLSGNDIIDACFDGE